MDKQDLRVLTEFRRALEDGDTSLAFRILVSNQDLYNQMVDIKEEVNRARDYSG